jgi:hypothetical protein
MAYAVSIGDFQFTEDFVWSGFESAGIRPNTTYEVRIPISDSIKPVDITAAILADGNGDGNGRYCRKLRISIWPEESRSSERLLSQTGKKLK